MLAFALSSVTRGRFGVGLSQPRAHPYRLPLVDIRPGVEADRAPSSTHLGINNHARVHCVDIPLHGEPRGYCARPCVVRCGPICFSQFVGSYAMAILYVTSLTALVAWATHCHLHRNAFFPPWALFALRVMGRLISSTLFVPVLFLLLSGFSCGDEVGRRREGMMCDREGNLHSKQLSCGSRSFSLPYPLTAQGAAAQCWRAALGGSCTSTAQMGPVIVSTLALIALVVLAPLFALLYVDTHPLSSSASAAAHGHLGLLVLVAQAVLISVVSIPPPAALTTPIRTAVVGAAAAAWFWATLAMMPHYHHSMCGGEAPDSRRASAHPLPSTAPHAAGTRPRPPARQPSSGRP